MPIPANITDFKELILRQLGKPIINIEVTDEQIEDCINMALSYYYDYHYDGSERYYMRYKITQTDLDNKFLIIPEEVIGVVRVFPIYDINSYSGNGLLFDVNYQFMASDLLANNGLTNISLVPYYITMMGLQQIQDIFNGNPTIRYNRNKNKLYIDTNWSKLSVDMYIIIECFTKTDASENTDIWSDRWFTQYVIQLVKRVWGNNVKKYNGMKLPDGRTFDGQKIYDEANTEIQRLENEMLVKYMLPPLDQIG